MVVSDRFFFCEHCKTQCAHRPPLDNEDVIGSNQFLCLPKAELNTKNSTKQQLCCRLVEFLLFNSALGRCKQ